MPSPKKIITGGARENQIGKFNRGSGAESKMLNKPPAGGTKGERTMTWYIITKDGELTNLQTPNGLYLMIGLEFLKETNPDYRWDYVVKKENER